MQGWWPRCPQNGRDRTRWFEGMSDLHTQHIISLSNSNIGRFYVVFTSISASDSPLELEYEGFSSSDSLIAISSSVSGRYEL